MASKEAHPGNDRAQIKMPVSIPVEVIIGSIVFASCSKFVEAKGPSGLKMIIFLSRKSSYFNISTALRLVIGFIDASASQMSAANSVRSTRRSR